VRWSAEPTPIETVRSDFAVKVRAMPFGDRDAVVADIARQRAAHVDRLAYYRSDAAKRYPEPDRLDESELPTYLVLRGGIRTEQTYIDWCDEMLAALTPERAASTPEEREP